MARTPENATAKSALNFFFMRMLPSLFGGSAPLVVTARIRSERTQPSLERNHDLNVAHFT